MITRENCLALDAGDALSGFREEFALPPGLIYLDGNSLGAMPKAATEYLARTTADWREGLVRSWNSAGWFDAPLRLGHKLAPLLGADGNEVVVTDSLSVNLFKMLVAGWRLRAGRRVILAEADGFPSDLYVAESVRRLSGGELRCRSVADVATAINSDTAVVCLSHVDFKSARMHDMVTVTRRAHEAGAVVLWNLAHSVGAVPLELSRWNVDLAVGCGYKYLNGGPGAPSFVYAAERLHEAITQPLCGWFSHSKPFEFDPRYRPADGIRRTLCGTPPILAFAALEASLDMFRRVDMTAVREKSVAMTDLFIHLIDQECRDGDLSLASPCDAEQRGSHVSLAHPHGYAVMQALIDAGVVGDFRAPNLMRFGFAPLYLRFVDVWDAVRALAEILHSRSWRRPGYQRRQSVT